MRHQQRKRWQLAEQEGVGRMGSNIQTWITLMKKETEYLGFWYVVKSKCLNRKLWRKIISENCESQRCLTYRRWRRTTTTTENKKETDQSRNQDIS